MKNKGYTLAEVMIVLVVLGVLAGILIPIANNSGPDKNIIKFRKADETLKNVIKELVEGDKYYCNGDLGMKKDCTTYILNNDETRAYFCNSIADLLTTKKVNCRTEEISINSTGAIGRIVLTNQDLNDISGPYPVRLDVTAETISATKTNMDNSCKIVGSIVGADIITTDDISYYAVGNVSQLGVRRGGKRMFAPPNQFPANIGDQNGFDIAYLVYCIDVDGIPEGGSENCDDKKDVCPFGYGIRADGKIMTGARADEWLEKSMHKKDKEE